MARLAAVPGPGRPDPVAEAVLRLRRLSAELGEAASDVLVATAEAAGGQRGAVVAEGPLLLTVAQVAAELGLSEAKTWALVGAGEIPSVTVGRTRRVRRGDLAVYVAGL